MPALQPVRPDDAIKVPTSMIWCSFRKALVPSRQVHPYGSLVGCSPHENIAPHQTAKARREDARDVGGFTAARACGARTGCHEAYGKFVPAHKKQFPICDSTG